MIRNARHGALAGLLAAWAVTIPWAAESRGADGEEREHDRKEERLQQVLAIVTEVAGAASAELPGNRIVPVRAYQLVPEGTSFRLAPGGWLTLACGGGAVRIEESGPVSAEQCRESAARAGSRISSRGRVNVWNGSPVLEGGTRVRDAFYGIRPVLVRPRCPNEMSWPLGCPRLLKPPLEIAWTEVEKSSRYDVILNEGDDLEAKDAACSAHPSAGYRVCTLAWPDDWPVGPGETRFLRVSARIDLFEQVSSEKTKIEILGAEEASEIEEEVAAVGELGLDVRTRRLALASLYAERELYNEAVAVLEEAVLEESGPVLHLALGDAYVKVAWFEAASRRYRHVLDHLVPDDPRTPELRAAAELGLGWANYLDARLEPAREHFHTAKALAERAGFPELAEQAGAMAKRIKDE